MKLAIAQMVLGALIVGSLFVDGCAEIPPEERAEEPHPEELEGSRWFPDSLRWLTDAEKDKLIEIALNTPEAARARETYSLYETSLRWVAINWRNHHAAELWGLDYECVDEGVPANVPESAEFYSQVVIDFGEPPRLELRVAINPDTGKVAHVEAHGLKILPTASE